MKYNSSGQNNFASENSNCLDKEFPLNILKTHMIDSSTDYLIIGDSCINKLNPNKMNTGSYLYVQKIFVSGMQSSNLLTWLETIMNQQFPQLTSMQVDNNHAHDQMIQSTQQNGVTVSDGKGNAQSMLPIKPYSPAHEISSEKSEIFNQLNLLLQKMID